VTWTAEPRGHDDAGGNAGSSRTESRRSPRTRGRRFKAQSTSRARSWRQGVSQQDGDAGLRSGMAQLHRRAPSCRQNWEASEDATRFTPIVGGRTPSRSPSHASPWEIIERTFAQCWRRGMRRLYLATGEHRKRCCAHAVQPGSAHAQVLRRCNRVSPGPVGRPLGCPVTLWNLCFAHALPGHADRENQLAPIQSPVPWLARQPHERSHSHTKTTGC